MTADSTRDAVRTFIRETFPAARSVRDEDSLLDSGIVDSLGILDIVTFLESRFGLQLADDDVVVENFASIDAITRFVDARTGADS